MRRIAKLRKHLSASVPAELVARPVRKASHQSVVTLPPRPSTSPAVHKPEVDYERLKKLRRHLSTSVPEHLVLKLPPKLDMSMFYDVEEDEVEEEQGDKEAGYWSEPERGPDYHELTVADDDPLSIEIELGTLGRSEQSGRSERPWPPTPTSTHSSFRPVRIERGNRPVHVKRGDGRESAEYAHIMDTLRSLRSR